MISELVKKEAGLAAMPLTYIFIAFSAMTMIPKYPILVGPFFICLGIFYSFQFAREHNDTLYTVLLPVSKKDAVKAKYIFVCLVQAISFILICLFSFLRVSLAKTSDVYADNTMLGASAAYLGSVLIVFALFNTVFLASFYKTAYAIGKPFLAFSVCAFFIYGRECEILRTIQFG